MKELGGGHIALREAALLPWSSKEEGPVMVENEQVDSAFYNIAQSMFQLPSNKNSQSNP